MKGFLLDTNTVAYAFDKACAENSRVVAKLTALASIEPSPPLFVSAITMGEIEYGHRLASPATTALQTEFERSIREAYFPLPVTGTTREPYGAIRSALFKKYAPKTSRKGSKKWVEQLLHPETALSLGIQENDLWIAAQALENNLVLVTHDKMSRILSAAGPGLTIEDWAAPP